MNHDTVNEKTTPTAAPRPKEGSVDRPKPVELFTHPICNGCQEALGVLSKLEKDGVILLRVTSLSTSSGRQRADELGVTTVPTAHVDGSFKVLMRMSDLADLVGVLRGI